MTETSKLQPTIRVAVGFNNCHLLYPNVFARMCLSYSIRMQTSWHGHTLCITGPLCHPPVTDGFPSQRMIDSFPPGQMATISQMIFSDAMSEKLFILIKISLKLVPKGPINNNNSLLLGVQFIWYPVPEDVTLRYVRGTDRRLKSTLTIISIRHLMK